MAVYGDMLAACQSIVDRYVIQCGHGSGMADVLPSFHSMRCATTRQDWDAVRHAEAHTGCGRHLTITLQTILDDFIKPVNPQRREMVRLLFDPLERGKLISSCQVSNVILYVSQISRCSLARG